MMKGETFQVYRMVLKKDTKEHPLGRAESR